MKLFFSVLFEKIKDYLPFVLGFLLILSMIVFMSRAVINKKVIFFDIAQLLVIMIICVIYVIIDVNKKEDSWESSFIFSFLIYLLLFQLLIFSLVF